jgi:DNA-binding beta-propeller fold protein YncE
MNLAAPARARPSEPELLALAGGWAPHTWLGAPAPGGLALPSAQPTASFMYAPRGVHLDAERLVVADSGNHRVLIWHQVPDDDAAPADVVLGQPDFTTEGPAAGGRGPERGLHLPTGVLVHDGRLVVADAWHHRVLVWDEVPTSLDVAPDLVLGQPDLTSVEPNAGRTCDRTTFYWPFGVAMVAGRFYVTDTGNRRVLGWSGGLPTSPTQAPDLVLGQADDAGRSENRGDQVGAASFRWPHDVAGDGDRLLVADAGNHRVLGWQPHPVRDRGADLLLGQAAFDTALESQYAPQDGAGLRFPYSIDSDGRRIVVTDTANNRVLVWDGAPDGQLGSAPVPATAVLGQYSMSGNGENRWTSVDRDTFCWPYGISLAQDLLAVADSGNNRVMIWRRST